MVAVKSFQALALLAQVAMISAQPFEIPHDALIARDGGTWSCEVKQTDKAGAPTTLTVSDSDARNAAGTGGRSSTPSGYPHEFGNNGNPPLVFYQACKGKKLLEYPVFETGSGKKWRFDLPKGQQAENKTPMRVIYTDEPGSQFCGVMTHEEMRIAGKGEGNFVLCHNDANPYPASW